MQHKKSTLAVVLIVKNEAEHLAACLTSVADWVDEIVVLDSGSTDNTLEIAAQFQARIFTHTPWPGFGLQRRIAQSHVQSEWVLWLDADERVTPELKQAIQSIMHNPPLNTVYAMPRLSWAFGRFIRHSGWYPGYVVRLFPKDLASYDDALVHEKVMVPPHAQVHHLTGDLLHYPYRDIQHYCIKVAAYTKTWAEQQKNKGKTATIAQGVGHAVACFIRMYVLKRGFLDGSQGFVLATVGAYTTFIKYAELWLQSKKTT